MPFGYTPQWRSNDSIVKYAALWVVCKLCGWPNFIRRLQWPIIECFLDIVPGMVVLDLGAGEMQYTAELAKKYKAHIVASDMIISSDKRLTLVNHEIKLIIADGQYLPFRSFSVDRILLSSVVQMVQDPHKLLNECRRVLKKNGVIVLSVPNDYLFMKRFIELTASHPIMQKLLFGRQYSYDEFLDNLNIKFNVRGPKGYYSIKELQKILVDSGLSIQEHSYSLSSICSFFWEISVFLFIRFGNIAFHLIFFTFPIALLLNRFPKSTNGSEHIVRAVRKSSVCPMRNL